MPSDPPRHRNPRRRPGGPVDLLEQIFDGRPNVPRARCVDQWAVYDAAAEGNADALRTASWLCRQCAHRIECPDSHAPEGAR